MQRAAPKADRRSWRSSMPSISPRTENQNALAMEHIGAKNSGTDHRNATLIPECRTSPCVNRSSIEMKLVGYTRPESDAVLRPEARCRNALVDSNQG
jgi:hypothetical protein